MIIAHAALWTTEIERLASFWNSMFDADIGDIYESRNRPGFRSRFLKLPQSPALEIVTGPWIGVEPEGERAGYAHVAVALGSADAVDAMADRAGRMGVLKSPPRMTGDGFYEAVLIDPDGKLVEITS